MAEGELLLARGDGGLALTKRCLERVEVAPAARIALELNELLAPAEDLALGLGQPGLAALDVRQALLDVTESLGLRVQPLLLVAQPGRLALEARGLGP